ncbi:ankyrin 3 [Rhypophila decipiens]|uniref:Ankyrin 3 n=1 Tax=Rhypophila decipiens TaxID=261697 RepID=A0AAN7B5I3_9PEZI|nr:ankyrin 3 [Rhypophila decipiens]
MGGFYMGYLDSLCRRRGWPEPLYECLLDSSGYAGHVFVNGREYRTDFAYESIDLAQENAAMRAFMVCRNFSVNGGILARNGIVQGMPAVRPQSSIGFRPPARPMGFHGYPEPDDMDDRQPLRRLPRYKDPSGSMAHPPSAASATNPSNHQSHLSSGRGSPPPTGTFESSDFLSQSRADAPSNRALEQQPHRNLSKQSAVSEPPSMHSPELTSALHLAEALAAHDYNKTQWLLEHRFNQVATREYSWLKELKKLDYSPLEITDELLEKAILGPWIFEPFTPLVSSPFDTELHLHPCVHFTSGTAAEGHVRKEPNSEALTKASDSTGPVLSSKESIEYHCGLAGVRPTPEGSTELQLGSVGFSEDNSVATVTLVGPEDGSAVLQILENLEYAAGALQTLGGSCNSFTFLFMVDRMSDKNSRPCVELQRVPFSVIRRLRHCLDHSLQADEGDDLLYFVDQVMPFLPTGLLQTGDQTTDADDRVFLVSLTAQFLSLAFLSYSQADCGPIMPFFLDTALNKVVLTGNGGGNAFNGLTVCGSLVMLTCMGDMTGKPVFAFRCFKSEQEQLTMDISSTKFDLIASAEDIIDTWGPGTFVSVSSEEPDMLLSIAVGNGTITSAPIQTDKIPEQPLHWSRGSKQPRETEPFHLRLKYRIGTTIIENTQCCANANTALLKAVPLLEDLDTFPSYWEIAERELGLGLQGGGQIGLTAAFQFNQTWVKMGGTTKKAAMLCQRAFFRADLESLFGVQVSVCTGIARRVRLRELVADILPAYVAGLVTKPRLWASLVNTHHLITALRSSDIRTLLDSLDHQHQTVFEGLVTAVLHLLRGTGIDRKGEDFVVACIQPDLPFRCFKIPCRKENYWTRMLADSEDTATFAYVTTRCLETARMQCCGPAVSWRNSASLLWTAVSCYEERVAAATTATPNDKWGLKHCDAYLIGRPDAALSVQVDRPNEKDEPRLLASCSTIPPQYLYRLFRKARPGKPKRLREMKCFDQTAESVVVLVGGPQRWMSPS